MLLKLLTFKQWCMVINSLFIILIVIDFIKMKKVLGQMNQLYLRIMINMKLLAIIIFLFFYLIGCASKTKYIEKPLPKPPARYEIGTITNTQQELLEYTKAIFHIARWQNWYNSAVGTNYYNYYGYSNYLYNKPKEAENINLVILSNEASPLLE